MSDMAPVMPPQVPSIQKLGPDLLTRPSRAWMKLWCVPSMVEEANKQAGWCDWGGGAHASACVEAPFDEVRPKVKGHRVRREENEEDDAEGQPGVEALPGRQESGNEARERQTQGHRKEFKKREVLFKYLTKSEACVLCGCKLCAFMSKHTPKISSSLLMIFWLLFVEFEPPTSDGRGRSDPPHPCKSQRSVNALGFVPKKKPECIFSKKEPDSHPFSPGLERVGQWLNNCNGRWPSSKTQT